MTSLIASSYSWMVFSSDMQIVCILAGSLRLFLYIFVDLEIFMKFSNSTHLGMIEGSHFSTPTEAPPLKLRPELRLLAITITSMTKLLLTEVVMPNFLKIIIILWILSNHFFLGFGKPCNLNVALHLIHNSYSRLPCNCWFMFDFAKHLLTLNQKESVTKLIINEQAQAAEQTNRHTEHNYCYRLLGCPVHLMYFESEIRQRHKL